MVDKIVEEKRGEMGGDMEVMWKNGEDMEEKKRKWEWRFKEDEKGIEEKINWFESYKIWFIIKIKLMVMGLMVWVVISFRERVKKEK